MAPQMTFVVTLDGPAAAGKSTTARALADRLGFQFLDTGAFYRAFALKAQRAGVRPEDTVRLAAMAQATSIRVSGSPRHYHVFLDDEDVSAEIRSPAVSEMASRIAAVPQVRRTLAGWQREMRERGPLVGEGRDLGTVVFPDAEVKIYLDADAETRARRRCRELQSNGLAARLEEVREDIERRDARDRGRVDSPLKSAHDAIVVDTSGMELEAQIVAVLRVIRAHPDCPSEARDL